jgi:hypothetical protein
MVHGLIRSYLPNLTALSLDLATGFSVSVKDLMLAVGKVTYTEHSQTRVLTYDLLREA